MATQLDAWLRKCHLVHWVHDLCALRRAGTCYSTLLHWTLHPAPDLEPHKQTLTNRNPTSSEDTPLSLVSSSSLPSLKDVSPHGSVSYYYTSFGMVLMTVSRFNSDDNYPNNSYRDRIRFLLFVSWWTVVFTAGYLAFFIINAGSFLVSIASHGIFLALT